MATPKKKPAAALTKEPAEKELSLVWAGLEATPVRSVNNTICQFHEDLFIVGFGFTNPPVLIGSAAAIKEQIGSLEAVLVTPVARIGVTEAHLKNIIKAFQDTLKRYQKQKDSEKK